MQAGGSEAYRKKYAFSEKGRNVIGIHPYRKDYEIKAAVYFSLQRYCCYHGEYKKAIGYLDAAEALIEARLGRAGKSMGKFARRSLKPWQK